MRNHILFSVYNERLTENRLVPVLLNQMVYQDDDMALLAADDDETVPDEPKDIKPFVYMPKSKGEEEEDDTDEVTQLSIDSPPLQFSNVRSPLKGFRVGSEEVSCLWFRQPFCYL